MACFHGCGTVEVKTERLSRWATGRQKSGAPSLRNQAGRPSSPVAVARRWSSILKRHHTSYSFIIIVIIYEFQFRAVFGQAI